MRAVEEGGIGGPTSALSSSESSSRRPLCKGLSACTRSCDLLTRRRFCFGSLACGVFTQETLSSDYNGPIRDNPPMNMREQSGYD